MNQRLREFPACQPLALALANCHTEHNYAKFLGKCNTFKYELDECLDKEFHKRRSKALKKSRAHDRRFAEHLKKHNESLRSEKQSKSES
mmetsp:Transcript_17485/g.30582  ORF Transcript_17485/g.30582 Transcript_17485/m.30582 type:complete len:89 (+) Transcript_17485:209-475(+)